MVKRVKCMPISDEHGPIANQIRKRLRQADIERRVKEAEATLAELKPVFEKANAEMPKP
jgi:hypothetical protein